MSIAQIRISGDEKTVKAVVEALNTAELDDIEIALKPPRRGRRGNYLAYGTVHVQQTGYVPLCGHCGQREAVAVRQGVGLCEDCVPFHTPMYGDE